MNRHYLLNWENASEAAPLLVLGVMLQAALEARELSRLTVKSIPEDELQECISCAQAANRWEQTTETNLALF